jgi:hypothetical protein
MFGNYLGGVGGSTTQRIHELLFREGHVANVEVVWIETNLYTKLESELKEQHKETYGQLPPWTKR